MNNGNNLDKATQAFEKIATHHPEKVADNGERLYELARPRNEESVQKSAITSLILAHFEYDGDYLGQDTYDILNAMLGHDSPEIQRNASELLMKGVSEYDYYVRGKHINEALQSKNPVTRYNAALSLRVHVQRKESNKQLAPCIKSILKNGELVLKRIREDKIWYKLCLEIAKLFPYTVQVQPQLIDRVGRILDSMSNLEDGNILVVTMESGAKLIQTNPEYFINSGMERTDVLK